MSDAAFGFPGPVRCGGAWPDGGLAGGSVLLRPAVKADASELHEVIHGDDSIAPWTRIPWPYTREHAAAFVGLSERGWRSGTDAACVIVDPDSLRIVGGVGLHRIGAAPAARSSYLPDEVGYWLATGARGRGLATRALGLLSRWAIRELGRPQLNLQTRAGNEASCRVAARAGYRFVRRVSATEVDDDPHDHDRFVLTPADLVPD